jgi:hypothetical protein
MKDSVFDLIYDDEDEINELIPLVRLPSYCLLRPGGSIVKGSQPGDVVRDAAKLPKVEFGREEEKRETNVYDAIRRLNEMTRGRAGTFIPKCMRSMVSRRSVGTDASRAAASVQPRRKVIVDERMESLDCSIVEESMKPKDEMDIRFLSCR